jgi:hypothetical protein
MATITTTLCHYHFPLSSSSFKIHKPILSHSPRHLTLPFKFQPKTIPSRFPLSQPPRAYVTGPASDPNVAESDPKLDGLNQEKPYIPKVITWELLSLLLLKHKFRLAVCVASLFACTTCTLSMPIFSGNFFVFCFFLYDDYYCVHSTCFGLLKLLFVILFLE